MLFSLIIFSTYTSAEITEVDSNPEIGPSDITLKVFIILKIYA